MKKFLAMLIAAILIFAPFALAQHGHQSSGHQHESHQSQSHQPEHRERSHQSEHRDNHAREHFRNGRFDGRFYTDHFGWNHAIFFDWVAEPWYGYFFFEGVEFQLLYPMPVATGECYLVFDNVSGNYVVACNGVMSPVITVWE